MLGKASTLFFLINIGILSAQVDTLYKLDFTENASSQIKFSVYLDSLISNMYKNIELSDNIVNSCLQLIEEEKDQISDSLQMEFIINRIYLEYNKIKPIAAYQIISEASVGLNEMDITTDQIATFNYLKSFTDMSLGDLESAQISYYSEIERGKSIHDFKTVYRNLYSLAILLKEEGNYESSIKFLNESIEYWEQIKVEPSTMAFTHIELANAYIALENYEKAFEHLAKAEKLADDNKLNIIKSDVLYAKGFAYYSKNDIANAEKINKELIELSKITDDPNLAYNRSILQADIFVAKKDHKHALEIYDKILASTDSTELTIKMQTYEKSYTANAALNDYESAFKDLREYNLIRNEIDNDKRRQQTEYLRTKYNTEQMAKANELLSLEINKQKLEQRFLLAGVIILFVILGLIYQLLRQKKEYNLMLEQKVAERTDQLEQSNKILMETNMELERFVFIASHDLKTPLNNIINFTKLLEKRLSNSEDKDTHEYLSFIKEGGIRLNKLIKDTLEYSKQSMQEDQQFEQIDLNKLLEQVEQSISNYIQINNAKIIKQNNLPKIEAHHSSIVVLFQNLIENGIKYNESTEPTINIYHKETNRHHSIFVEDNGIGISEEYHEKVFTMFTRLHSHYTYEGSGLGLSICKKIMQKMGGDITLIKNNDTGSIFELKFPLDIIYTQRI